MDIKILVAKLNSQNEVILDQVRLLEHILESTRTLLLERFDEDMDKAELTALRTRRKKKLNELARHSQAIQELIQSPETSLIHQMSMQATVRRKHIAEEDRLARASREAIHQAFHRGMDYREVGEHMPVDRGLLWRLQKKWETEGRPGTLDPDVTVREIGNKLASLHRKRKKNQQEYEEINNEVIDLVKKAYKAGVNQQMIEAHTGIKRSTLRVWLGLGDGWNPERRSRSRRSKAREKDE